MATIRNRSNFPISTPTTDLDLEIPPVSITGDLCLINPLISLFRISPRFHANLHRSLDPERTPTNPTRNTERNGGEQTIKGERYRLNIVVVELDKTTSAEYQIALLAFINCVIISAATLQDRIRMRNEFIGEYLIYLQSALRREARGSLRTTYLTVKWHD